MLDRQVSDGSESQGAVQCGVWAERRGPSGVSSLANEAEASVMQSTDKIKRWTASHGFDSQSLGGELR